jgi:uncharacterized protein YecA (UPF0149 family)
MQSSSSDRPFKPNLIGASPITDAIFAVSGQEAGICINKGNRMENNYEESEHTQFEITSKRRKGFPSETRVKRGVQIVHGDKQLTEKLGRNDLCPCGSMRRF